MKLEKKYTLNILFYLLNGDPQRIIPWRQVEWFFSFWERIYFEHLLIHAFRQMLCCLRRQMTKGSGIYIVLVSPSARLDKSCSVMTLVNLSPVAYMKYNHFCLRVQLRKSISSPPSLYTWGKRDGKIVKTTQNKTKQNSSLGLRNF